MEEYIQNVIEIYLNDINSLRPPNPIEFIAHYLLKHNTDQKEE